MLSREKLIEMLEGLIEDHCECPLNKEWINKTADEILKHQPVEIVEVNRCESCNKRNIDSDKVREFRCSDCWPKHQPVVDREKIETVKKVGNI